MASAPLTAADPAGALVPRYDQAIHAGMNRDTTIWWALDIAEARSMITAIAFGTAAPVSAQTLLAAVRIADLNENAIHLLASYRGRRSMIRQPIADYVPRESWSVLADLIVAVVADYPVNAPLTRKITSILFIDPVMNISQADPETHPDIVLVSVGGEVPDDRSMWTIRASEQRYSNLIHHLPSALIQVDSRPMSPIFADLRDRGITEIGAYLDEHPKLSAHSREIVKVTLANRKAVKLFGADCPEALVGSVGFVFAASPETAKRVITAHFEGRRSYSERMKLRRFDGVLRDVELSVTYPTPPERLDITLLMFEDVTERLRTETQLRQLQADFSRAGRIATLGELATSIAHEVSQPLSAIVTNAETSLRWLAREDANLPKVEQLTQRIAESALRAHEIVQRIRGMAARHAPEPMPLDINAVIEEALLFVHHDMESRSIALSVALAPALPVIVGDRVQLQQVIVNLLLNSIQAIGQHGPRAGRIEVRTEAGAEGSVVVIIRDNGPGIAADDFDRVFEGFFTTKEDGIGIGLAICHSIITAHGGRIAASNHAEGGARFEIRLPPTPPYP